MKDTKRLAVDTIITIGVFAVLYVWTDEFVQLLKIMCN